eukprot:scaffold26888_cov137-Cylindrotheca_fusiformis.AAC.3
MDAIYILITHGASGSNHQQLQQQHRHHEEDDDEGNDNEEDTDEDEDESFNGIDSQRNMFTCYKDSQREKATLPIHSIGPSFRPSRPLMVQREVSAEAGPPPDLRQRVHSMRPIRSKSLERTQDLMKKCPLRSKMHTARKNVLQFVQLPERPLQPTTCIQGSLSKFLHLSNAPLSITLTVDGMSTSVKDRHVEEEGRQELEAREKTKSRRENAENNGFSNEDVILEVEEGEATDRKEVQVWSSQLDGVSKKERNQQIQNSQATHFLLNVYFNFVSGQGRKPNRFFGMHAC